MKTLNDNIILWRNFVLPEDDSLVYLTVYLTYFSLNLSMATYVFNLKHNIK